MASLDVAVTATGALPDGTPHYTYAVTPSATRRFSPLGWDGACNLSLWVVNGWRRHALDCPWVATQPAWRAMRRELVRAAHDRAHLVTAARSWRHGKAGQRR